MIQIGVGCSNQLHELELLIFNFYFFMPTSLKWKISFPWGSLFGLSFFYVFVFVFAFSISLCLLDMEDVNHIIVLSFIWLKGLEYFDAILWRYLNNGILDIKLLLWPAFCRCVGKKQVGYVISI